MAERRMFAKTIIDSDAFLDMPISTQVLYFHLAMRADDDGFLNNPKKIQKFIGCTDDDFKILIAKQFILPFESGVIVIKHWRIHNYIRSDRYKPTVYEDEKAQLYIKGNNAYTFNRSEGEPLVGTVTPIGIPSVNQTVYQMDTQDRLGKDSIGEDTEENIEKEDLVFLTSMDGDKPKVKRAGKKNELVEVLDSYGFDTELREAIIDFIAMRKAKKKPLTPRALKLVINKLMKLSKDLPTQIAIVEQSILHNWETVYELKENGSWGKTNSSSDSKWNGMTVSTEKDAWKDVENL